MAGIQRVIVRFLRLIADILIAYFGDQSFPDCFDESATGARITSAIVTVRFKIVLVTDEFFGFIAQLIAQRIQQ